MGNTLVLSIKISLLSLTILSLALLIKLYLPPMSELLSSWLTRPFLYVVINLIIITIAASSMYQHKTEAEEEEEPLKVPVPVEFQQNFAQVYEEEEEPVKVPVPVEFQQNFAQVYEEEVEVQKEMIKDLMVEEAKMTVGDGIGVPVEYSVSKPPVSARFSNRKIPKGSPEAGKSLKVSKPKRQDTLESTWKMITEGRSMPLARHLKKSDTWETHTHTPKVQKSETFNNVSPITPSEPPASSESSTSVLARSQGSGSMKLKKEPSLSQDDLNRRVEAFINKFNEEMRLQRLESLNRYKEMVV